MELPDHSQDALAAREPDDQNAGIAAAPRGVKRESDRAIAHQTRGTEENWSALSNLCVAGAESGEISPTQALTQAFFDSTELVGSTRQTDQRTSSYAQSTQDDGGFSKSSLSFILGDQAAAGAWNVTLDDNRVAYLAQSKNTATILQTMLAPGLKGPGATQITHAVAKLGADGKRRARRPPSRICKHEGCEQYVVDQGLCVRHGGGKRCLTLGCTSRAKHLGRCWKHGALLRGSTECKVPSCINRAKSRGFCWSHGGGTKCKVDNCEKIAISNALCWAHGGGKRCAIEGCMRQAYERTGNLCNNHYHERQQDTTAMSTPDRRGNGCL